MRVRDRPVCNQYSPLAAAAAQLLYHTATTALLLKLPPMVSCWFHSLACPVSATSIWAAAALTVLHATIPLSLDGLNNRLHHRCRHNHHLPHKAIRIQWTPSAFRTARAATHRSKVIRICRS